MRITVQGIHDDEATIARLQEVLHLFKTRYRISCFREIHLDITLVDEQGMDVELIDQESNRPYRHFKVCEQETDQETSSQSSPLRLVVDNS